MMDLNMGVGCSHLTAHSEATNTGPVASNQTHLPAVKLEPLTPEAEAAVDFRKVVILK